MTIPVAMAAKTQTIMQTANEVVIPLCIIDSLRVCGQLVALALRLPDNLPEGAVRALLCLIGLTLARGVDEPL